MANSEHVKLVKRGADAIKKWRKKKPVVRLDLSGADLRLANLSEANLFEANLFEANLSEADLSEAFLRGAKLIGANITRANLGGADLCGADLSEANLRGANLGGADLIGAFLIGADLRGANLGGANITGANLGGADLCGAELGWTTIAAIELRTVKGLDSVQHRGPSTIGTNTLVLLQGEISKEIAVFLQGCGLQPWEILHAKMYDPALTPAEICNLQIKVFEKRTAGPLFISGVFISYSRADSEFVDKVYERLSKEGVNVWLDRHDLVSGGLQEQVGHAIRLQDVVLLVLSKASTKSDWVENELDMARKKEKKAKGQNVLCPIAIDATWKRKLKDDADDRALWRTLTKKAILDFSDPAKFDEQFAKLLRGLKVNYGDKAKE